MIIFRECWQRAQPADQSDEQWGGGEWQNKEVEACACSWVWWNKTGNSWDWDGEERTNKKTLVHLLLCKTLIYVLKHSSSTSALLRSPGQIGK